ncbi:MAG: hypothetical protein WAM21_05195 [Steroidobacteraceae bacterium]
MIHRKTLMAAGLICATLGLQGLAYASPPAPQLHGITWTLSQAPAEGWTEGQPISLLLGVGASDPHHRWISASQPPPDASLVTATAPGWTRPIGLRLAVRW